MEALPYEIKARICDHVVLWPRNDDDEEKIHQSRLSLKSLRRVCKSWSDIPLVYLIGRLEVPIWGSGVRNLYYISQRRHLAHHVTDLTLRINFNIAEPHPAPYSRQNQKRASIATAPPRKNSLRTFVAAFKGSKTSSSPAVASSSRKMSIKVDGQSVENLLATFDALGGLTIASNLGRTGVADGFLSVLSQFSALLSEILGRLPRLKSLSFSNASQTEFMRKLAYEDVLRWAPTQDTWNLISEHVNSEIFLGLIRSGATIPDLHLQGGSIAWFATFYATVDESPAKTQLLRHYTSYLAGVTSLQISFDTGAYEKDVEVVESQRWGLAGMLRLILPRVSNLRKLEIHKCDLNFHSTVDSEPAFEIDAFVNLSQQLTSLTLGDLEFKTARLKELLRPLASSLVSLSLASTTLKDESWVHVFRFLHDELLHLEEFTLSGNVYLDSLGRWEMARGAKVVGGSLLSSVERYVVRELEDLGLPTADESRGAGQVWKERSDDSMRWTSRGEP